jgi:UDP-sugar transporter A1/2/3
MALVAHKCASDLLTRYTRVQGAYSITTVAIMSEVMKIPLILTAISTMGGGPGQIVPVFREAISKPFGNVWISLCYTFNNLLYFDALSSISAVAYQVLSQSKTLFTAGLMYVLVRKRLSPRQVIAILMLVSGAVLVQFQELRQGSAPSATAAAATPGSIYWACGLVLFSSFISALPNVAYEKKLKTEGENQWVNNVQVTAWITLWVSLNALVPYIRPALGGLVSGGASPSALLPLLASLPSSLVQAFSGFTLSVWGVVMLKALNGILIPATFKYADNLIYSYARPSSIVVTCLFGAVMARAVPPLTMLAGVAIVVTSIGLYNSKPAEKTA